MNTRSLSRVSLMLLVGLTLPAEAAENPLQPFQCQVTRPEGGLLENEALSVGLGRKYVFRPGGPGFVDSDGALGIKVLWTRKVHGSLEIGGKRLDGVAPPARAYMKDYGDSGIQPSYLLFPTPGCWEITGLLGSAKLTFVVLVEKIGEGPAWRFQGPERGSRVSSIRIEDGG
jgi:hypothetical protein